MGGEMGFCGNCGDRDGESPIGATLCNNTYTTKYWAVVAMLEYYPTTISDAGSVLDQNNSKIKSLKIVIYTICQKWPTIFFKLFVTVFGMKTLKASPLHNSNLERLPQ